jgi:hypothetical protein
MKRQQHASNHLLTLSAPHRPLSCIVHSVRKHQQYHAHLDPSHHPFRSTCPSWSRGLHPRSLVHHVHQSATQRDSFHLRRRCRHHLLKRSIHHTTWRLTSTPSSLITPKRQPCILWDLEAILSYMYRILWITTFIQLQKGQSRSSITSLPCQKWRT